MKTKWLGLAAVALAATAIIVYKSHHPAKPESSDVPRIVLVADLSEADAAGDGCAEIIHLVRSAHDRGIAVKELMPDSKSELLSRYRVLTAPTVLVLDAGGKIVSRYEGEGRETITAIRSALQRLQ